MHDSKLLPTPESIVLSLFYREQKKRNWSWPTKKASFCVLPPDWPQSVTRGRQQEATSEPSPYDNDYNEISLQQFTSASASPGPVFPILFHKYAQTRVLLAGLSLVKAIRPEHQAIRVVAVVMTRQGKVISPAGFIDLYLRYSWVVCQIFCYLVSPLVDRQDMIIIAHGSSIS